jgi:hypothetical protein
MSLRIWSAFALLALVSVACGTAADSDASTTTGGQTSSTISESTTTEPDMSQQAIIDAAVLDLTTHLGVEAEAITVVEEGMSYTQAIVDGHQVLLGVEDRVYDYHAGSDGVVFLCASDEKDGGRDFVPPPGIDT